MAKFRPGMPEGFDLQVAPVRDLGDFLDEPGITPSRPVRKPDPAPLELAPTDRREVASAPAPAQTPQRELSVVDFLSVNREATPEPEVEPEHDWPPRGYKEKSPRREISMTPETLRMSDELLEMIRAATGQRDAKANELFHAAILLLYEVRGELHLHSVPRRGKWGTPTARAFPVAIKSAFFNAVIARAKKS